MIEKLSFSIKKSSAPTSSTKLRIESSELFSLNTLILPFLSKFHDTLPFSAKDPLCFENMCLKGDKRHFSQEKYKEIER